MYNMSASECGQTRGGPQPCNVKYEPPMVRSVPLYAIKTWTVIKDNILGDKADGDED